MYEIWLFSFVNPSHVYLIIRPARSTRGQGKFVPPHKVNAVEGLPEQEQSTQLASYILKGVFHSCGFVPLEQTPAASAGQGENGSS